MLRRRIQDAVLEVFGLGPRSPRGGGSEGAVDNPGLRNTIRIIVSNENGNLVSLARGEFSRAVNRIDEYCVVRVGSRIYACRQDLDFFQCFDDEFLKLFLR